MASVEKDFLMAQYRELFALLSQGRKQTGWERRIKPLLFVQCL